MMWRAIESFEMPLITRSNILVQLEAILKNYPHSEHFFRAAAEAMRRILVERARQRAAEKCGHDPQRVELSDSKLQAVSADDQLLAVHEALDQLARRDPVSAEPVKLRYFAGLRMAEAAGSLGLPLLRAERLWTFAKTWLREEIQAGA